MRSSLRDRRADDADSDGMEAMNLEWWRIVIGIVSLLSVLASSASLTLWALAGRCG